MKAISTVSIAAVLLISACVQFQNFFGQDVLTINRKVTEEGSKDVLAIKDEQSIPRSPVLPNQPVLFSFIVENVDKAETAKNVRIDLFNAPIFKAFDNRYRQNPAAAPSCNPSPQQPESRCQPNQNEGENRRCSILSPCTILPGEQRQINFELLSPTEQEIARIKTDSELSYKLSYDFRGSMLYTVSAVNEQEIRSLQRQGKSVSLTEHVSHGPGPVQVEVQLFGTPYLLSEFEGTFIFNVKNKGKGTIANSKIAPGKLRIEFPAELFADDAQLTDPDGNKYSAGGNIIFGTATEPFFDFAFPTRPGQQGPLFTCNSGTQVLQGNIVVGVQARQAITCTNARDIDLFRGETKTTLRFSISRIRPVTEPFRTFLIRAFVDYNYELRSSFPMTVRPFER